MINYCLIQKSEFYIIFKPQESRKRTEFRLKGIRKLKKRKPEDEEC